MFKRKIILTLLGLNFYSLASERASKRLKTIGTQTELTCIHFENPIIFPQTENLFCSENSTVPRLTSLLTQRVSNYIVKKELSLNKALETLPDDLINLVTHEIIEEKRNEIERKIKRIPITAIEITPNEYFLLTQNQLQLNKSERTQLLTVQAKIFLEQFKKNLAQKRINNIELVLKEGDFYSSTMLPLNDIILGSSVGRSDTQSSKLDLKSKESSKITEKYIAFNYFKDNQIIAVKKDGQIQILDDKLRPITTFNNFTNNKVLKIFFDHKNKIYLINPSQVTILELKGHNTLEVLDTITFHLPILISDLNISQNQLIYWDYNNLKRFDIITRETITQTIDLVNISCIITNPITGDIYVSGTIKDEKQNLKRCKIYIYDKNLQFKKEFDYRFPSTFDDYSIFIAFDETGSNLYTLVPSIEFFAGPDLIKFTMSSEDDLVNKFLSGGGNEMTHHSLILALRALELIQN